MGREQKFQTEEKEKVKVKENGSGPLAPSTTQFSPDTGYCPSQLKSSGKSQEEVGSLDVKLVKHRCPLTVLDAALDRQISLAKEKGEPAQAFRLPASERVG